MELNKYCYVVYYTCSKSFLKKCLNVIADALQHSQHHGSDIPSAHHVLMANMLPRHPEDTEHHKHPKFVIPD